MLIRECFAEFEGVFEPPSSAFLETSSSVIEKLNAGVAFLAEDEGSLLGCVFCKREEDHVYLYRLAVLPRSRRHGIGRKLAELVEDQSLKWGVDRILLKTRIAVPANVRFYEQLGFEQIGLGCHPNLDVPTFAIMAKKLSNG